MVLDVGETLVNETREYGTWADWLGVLQPIVRALVVHFVVLVVPQQAEIASTAKVSPTRKCALGSLLSFPQAA